MAAVSLSLPSVKGGECAHSMPNSDDGDGTLGAKETASEVGNGISAMLALSEQVNYVLVVQAVCRFSREQVADG